jgi:hypothetical protein
MPFAFSQWWEHAGPPGPILAKAAASVASPSRGWVVDNSPEADNRGASEALLTSGSRLPAEPANGDKEPGRPPSGDDADVHPVKARAEKACL